jgi:putative DNA methylase
VTNPIKSPKKLIEVALPLDDINAAAAREKSIRHGHPSTLHLWWARRPLAAARAVLFAQMVNDPGYETGKGFTRGVNKKEATRERERLFDIIRELVKWENTNNEAVLERARAEIRKSWEETCELNKKHPQAAVLFNPAKLPAFHDPFAGGGAIPLEAQRLGLESHASDLNPVAVLINKAMIEIPPKFAGRKPVGPVPAGEKQTKMAEDWSGARGLAEDVRRYGRWMREEAQKRIGHLYPQVEITAEMAKTRPDLKQYVGQKLTVIAWLWARTVRSPNPAYSSVHVPLASSFLLSTKTDKESWVEPVVEGSGYRFVVKVADGKNKPPSSAKGGTKVSQGAFRCLMSDTPIKYEYVDAEANAGRLGARLMAVVVEGHRGRVYLSPIDEMGDVAASALPSWKPDTPCRGTFASNAQGRRYGFNVFGDYFTNRQLLALTVFSDLVAEVREKVRLDAAQSGYADDGLGLDVGGLGASSYADSIATCLALATDKSADYNSSLCGWISSGETLRSTFGRQAISMSWDYCEANIIGEATGSFLSVVGQMQKSLALAPAIGGGQIVQFDAQRVDIAGKVVSTDPPYYDNISYADLSDFFYVWLRRSARSIFPSLFATVAVPKAEELVATPYRHGGVEQAEAFFLDGMTAVMKNIAESAHGAFPVSIYYAFKQSDTSDAGTASTGWETFIQAVIAAGFAIHGTWPMRTERESRSIGIGANALASSIILVCHRRPGDAPQVPRREFQRELKEVLTEALEAMLGGADGASPIAPVDLAQAAIGPGMGVFSQYAAVLESNGEPMSVKTALMLINRQVDEVLGGETFDADTNFCLGWFDEVGFGTGAFGNADVLARAKATSVDAVKHAGVLASDGGKVRLLKPDEYPVDWDPRSDNRTPVWEALHQLIRAYNQGGESAAGTLLARMPSMSGDIRRLSYWLYNACAERKRLAEEARAYNELITAWHAIEAASHDAGHVNVQGSFDV